MLKLRILKKAYKSKSVDDILTSISSLKSEKNYSNVEYNGVEYPVIYQSGLRFAVLPAGVNIYKAIPTNSNLVNYFRHGKYPYPSFYMKERIAKLYAKHNYRVYRFQTTRPTKLLVLNDVNNLIELAKLFFYTSGIKGFLDAKNSVQELMMVTGLGIHCLFQEDVKSCLENDLDIDPEDYKLNTRMCNSIQDEALKRLSLYAIVLQFSRNMCNVLKSVGGDGYITTDMMTALGEITPIFHNDIMFCFTSDVLKQGEIVKN